jgi:uncharacterized membrane protein YGL010W
MPADSWTSAHDESHLDSTRRVDRLMAAYGVSHRHPLNQLIHWLAVPLIYWCVLALLAALPVPGGWRSVPSLDWGTVAALLVVLYIAALSVPLAVGMAALSAALLAAVAAYVRWGELPIWQPALFLFVLAWLAQLIGHKIEGRKPSFLTDLQFLLIGPAWLLAKIYRLVGMKY